MGLSSTIGLRVILVGRTGLDAALRLDPGVELSRVRTPVEAIAELATPIDLDSPSNAVVIVGSEAQDDLLTPRTDLGPIEVGQPLPGRTRVVEFMRGLRLVHPGVRILAVADGPAKPAAELYDATIAGDASPSAVRDALAPDLTRHQSNGFTPATSPASSTPPRGTGVPPVSTSSLSSSSSSSSTLIPGDEPLVEQVLHGRDVLPIALDLLRLRLNAPSIEFLDTESPRLKELLAAHAPGLTPVAGGEVTHGYLLAPPNSPAIEAHARWLAGWLRLRDQQSQLRQAAFTDPLTGAWNRRYLDRFLASAIQSAREHRWNLTVMVFDIDDFKRYNDQYGHEAGDEILVETVRLLRAATRPSDRVCRIGGDEFAAVFYEPTGPRSPDSKHPSSVFEIATRFQQQIVNHQFPKLAGCAPGTLTISGGLATYPWDGHTPAELLAKADERAMQSKRAGKNVITIGQQGS